MAGEKEKDKKYCWCEQCQKEKPAGDFILWCDYCGKNLCLGCGRKPIGEWKLCGKCFKSWTKRKVDPTKLGQCGRCGDELPIVLFIHTCDRCCKLLCEQCVKDLEHKKVAHFIHLLCDECLEHDAKIMISDDSDTD